jgi:hypothetical protein
LPEAPIFSGRSTDNVTALSFRAWLPTVTGRLSFSVFGQTSHPTKAISANVADEDFRYLCITQMRDTGDGIIPEAGLTHEFHFVLIACTVDIGLDKQTRLSGRAYIFSQSDWKNNKNTIEAFQHHLDNFRDVRHKNPDNSLLTFVGQRWDQIITDLNQHSIFHVGVEISRTGTTSLSYDSALITSATAPNLTEKRNLPRALSAQIFYFLKDIGHHHQHHDRHTDTITDLHPVYDKPESDLKWRADTLYSMYRKVIEYKRQPESLNFNDCLGLLAYSETFRKISMKELKLSKMHKNLPSYYYE